MSDGGAANNMKCYLNMGISSERDFDRDGHHRGPVPRSASSSARMAKPTGFASTFFIHFGLSPLLNVKHHTDTIDTRCLSDERSIRMKRHIEGSKETEMARFFSSKEMLDDPRNHCLPVLDMFSEEVVDFMGQTLEVGSPFHSLYPI